jgi:hypothetical protein
MKTELAGARSEPSCNLMTSGVVDYGRLAAAVAEIGKELDLIESPDTPVERLPLEPRSLADKVLILARSPERCCW